MGRCSALEQQTARATQMEPQQPAHSGAIPDGLWWVVFWREGDLIIESSCNLASHCPSQTLPVIHWRELRPPLRRARCVTIVGKGESLPRHKWTPTSGHNNSGSGSTCTAQTANEAMS